MPEKPSIKQGRKEAVMWILKKGDNILIEQRPEHEEGESICIPCGTIDLNQDKNTEETDYIESAFLRESKEEFAKGKFNPTEYRFLKTIDFDEKLKDGSIAKLRLHYFLITKWKGTIPKQTDSKAALKWLPISKYKELPQSCDRTAIKQL